MYLTLALDTNILRCIWCNLQTDFCVKSVTAYYMTWQLGMSQLIRILVLHFLDFLSSSPVKSMIAVTCKEPYAIYIGWIINFKIG